MNNKGSKWQPFFNFKCKYCGETKQLRASKYNKGLKYCSFKCYNKSRQMLRACLVCGKQRYIRKSVFEKRHGAKYCSHKCEKIALRQRTYIDLACETCGKRMKKRKKEWRKNKHHCCSVSCASKLRAKGRKTVKGKWIKKEL